MIYAGWLHTGSYQVGVTVLILQHLPHHFFISPGEPGIGSGWAE